MNLTEFVNKHIGKKVDFDGAFGAQCFTKNHYVLMGDWTYKPIQDVKVGDKVVGVDNKINTVVHTFVNEKDIVHIQTDLVDFFVTEEHPFYFANGDFLPAVYLTKEKPQLFDRENYIESGLTDNELRFFGFWLGDGNIAKHHDNKVDEIRITYGIKKRDFIKNLNLTGSEREHHETINAFVAGLLKREHEKLADIILRYCSEEKKLPLIFSNREYSLILEGFINADGSKKRKGYVISNTNLSLLYSLQAICIKLGYDTKTIRKAERHSVPIINGKVVKSVKPIYRLTINKKSRRTIKTKILERNRALVYNIETDGTHTYICNNYKVHNCVDLFRQYCKDVLRAGHTGAVEGAKDLFLRYADLPAECKYFDRISNTIPKIGDVLVWGATDKNKYGHVAICIGFDNENLIVFEQDGFKQDGAKLSVRTTKNLLGVLRFNGGSVL